MPRKVPITSTPEQRKEQSRKAKAHRQAERERRVAARVAEAPRRFSPGGPGRPFGSTGGYFKPWAKRIVGDFYTDVDLLRDFILLTPKERLAFILEFDPKLLGGSPEEIALRIQTLLVAIQASVPAPDPHGG